MVFVENGSNLNVGSIYNNNMEVSRSQEPIGENREYWMAKYKKSREESDILINEYRDNKKIIKDKVKGEIRKAQRRNKEIKEKLLSLKAQREPYLNLGVW
jgi:hypothetical protein